MKVEQRPEFSPQNIPYILPPMGENIFAWNREKIEYEDWDTLAIIYINV